MNHSVTPNTHPSWMQRYLPGFLGGLRDVRKNIKEIETLEQAKAEILRLSLQMESLTTAVTALNNHVAWQR